MSALTTRPLSLGTETKGSNSGMKLYKVMNKNVKQRTRYEVINIHDLSGEKGTLSSPGPELV